MSSFVDHMIFVEYMANCRLYDPLIFEYQSYNLYKNIFILFTKNAHMICKIFMNSNPIAPIFKVFVGLQYGVVWYNMSYYQSIVKMYVFWEYLWLSCYLSNYCFLMCKVFCYLRQISLMYFNYYCTNLFVLLMIKSSTIAF